jgi:6-phosphogluconolactonase (cycloisomerase 2 family)
MRLVAFALALAVLGARPAGAGRILYATAATPGRVDGFCIGNDGSLAPTPILSVDTVGGQPRRLIIANGVLYVAEIDRVESFTIGPNGGLVDRRSTHVVTKANGDNVNLDPHDLAVHPSGAMLYVPQRKVNRLVAYRLDAGGLAGSEFETCVQGNPGANFQHLAVTDTLLYLSGGNSFEGTIDVHPVGPDGQLLGSDGLPLLPATCLLSGPDQKRSDATTPLSTRTKLSQPRTVLLKDDLLYVEEQGRKRIAVFRLGSTSCLDGNVAAPGNFCPLVPSGKKGKKMKPQAAEAKTDPENTYDALAFDDSKSTILGTQFFHGRVDAYKLTPDELVPKHTSLRSDEDIRMSPVGLVASGKFLYVSGGAFDRVLAYGLADNGLLAAANIGPASRTDEQKGSFPNDVAVAVLSAGCD